MISECKSRTERKEDCVRSKESYWKKPAEKEEKLAANHLCRQVSKQMDERKTEVRSWIAREMCLMNAISTPSGYPSFTFFSLDVLNSVI